MAKNREFSLIAAYDELKKHIPNLRQKKRGCKPLDRLIKIYFFTVPLSSNLQILGSDISNALVNRK